MTFNLKNSLIVLIVLAVFLLSGNNAEACSCITLSLDGSIDISQNIAILKLQTIEKYGENEKGSGLYGIKQSRLTVEKSFKGNLKIGQELVFAQGGGADCVWTFSSERIGTEYLLFLDGKPDKSNLWRAYVCSRSNSVKGAAADLLYLNKMSKVAGKSRLSGTLAQEDEPAVEGQEGAYQHLAGKKVSIRGNGKDIVLKTDQNGIYEIYDLPAGKYAVTPESVNGYRIDEDDKKAVEVEITNGYLTDQDFDYKIDNSIAGKLLDTGGRPLAGVYVELLPVNGAPAANFDQGHQTDSDGDFRFDEIPHGTYIIIVNKNNKISAREPFGAFYYPNKLIRSEAAEITISAGEHFNGLTITAPTTAETIEISGVLLFEDGKPVTDGEVEFFNQIDEISSIKEYQRADSRDTTDENGKFRIKILKGQQGILFGEITAYVGQYANCPKLDALIRAQGTSIQDIRTMPIQITADNNLDEVTFKLPFPGCKKVRHN